MARVSRTSAASDSRRDHRRRPAHPPPPQPAAQGLAALRAVSAGCLSPAGQLQIATALEVIDALDTRLHELRHQLLDAARHLSGAKVLAARLYGVGPVTALAMTCWLGGAGRFSSSRKAVRFAGLDVTVHSSDRKGQDDLGRLSRSTRGPVSYRPCHAAQDLLDYAPIRLTSRHCCATRAERSRRR